MGRPSLIIHGMHGLGDNLHQRAFVRQLLETHDIWLETSWPCVYHDLIAQGGLHVIPKRVGLRTQTKNAQRERDKFSKVLVPPRTPELRPSYNDYNVARMPNRTILEAICGSLNIGIDYSRADFRLPIPYDWLYPADELIESWHATKPILIYRPLVVRTEWRGNEKRNADPMAYAEIFASIRDRFFVVSVADLVPGHEWIIGPQLKADVTLHNGELSFEIMAALFSRAKLVYTSSGFATLLAQAVGTPNISVIGLYENGAHHSAGASYAPYLPIEPLNPCSCQYSGCVRKCSKQIDIPSAISKVADFVHDLGVSTDVETRPITEMFDSPAVRMPQMPQRRIHSGLRA
jgi:ADP-heptose:LPS heptosyltransferase